MGRWSGEKKKKGMGRTLLLNHSGSVQRKWVLRRYQGSLAIKSCNDINRQTGRASDKSVSKRKEKSKSDFFSFSALNMLSLIEDRE